MANIREIKRRIKSVKNIAQVTRAMQMVAASKMRRAQAQALATRAYAQNAWEVLLHLAAQGAAEVRAQNRALLRQFPVKVSYLVLMTADKGLCGAYNTNIIRAALHFIRDNPCPVKVITVGRTGRDFILRYGYDVVAEFSDLPPQPSLLDISPIARMAINDYEQQVCDDVYLAYTEFITTLSQRPIVRRLLPISVATEMVEEQMQKYVSDVTFEYHPGEYIYEPDPIMILDTVLPRFTELQVYQAVLESLASEHSARMVAMRAASDNASELMGDLQLFYYRARQNAITTEILDIVGGAEALSKCANVQIRKES